MNAVELSVLDRLAAVRDRTFELYEPLSPADLWRSPDPIMSPPIWDLGHIGAYEELWLVCALTGAPSRYPELQVAYDAFETPRAERTKIRLLGQEECHRYLAFVRERAVEVLDGLDLDAEDPLTRDGFVFEMVAQHEAQHTETVLQAMQMFEDGTYRPPRGDVPLAQSGVADSRVVVDGGVCEVGAVATMRFAYDCELPRHPVTLRSFAIDRFPVSNARHLAFMDDGGYERPELWTAAGWAWRVEHAVDAPLYWRREGETWFVRSFDRVEPVRPDHPVCHVSWYEADAHARWAGARLPSESEWERAADGGGARYPWGEVARAEHANLDQMRFGTAPLGAFPEGESPVGCAQMIGDVWEWTSSAFAPYPGYAAFPYREYSEVFFGGGYRALRGGSWATQPVAARTTFRNWDHPNRRQIFSGFRLAWDLD